MSHTAKVGDTTVIGFALFETDAITRIEGAAGRVTVELWHSDRAGVETLVFLSVAGAAADPAVVEVQIVETARHDYRALIDFSGAPAGDYRLTVRDEVSKAELTETLQLFAADIDDVVEAVADHAAGLLVGISGVPAAAGDPVTVTLSFFNRSTMGLISPAAVASIKLYDTDGATLLQTKSGGDILTPAFGKRRTTFAALASAGRYFVAVTFTAVAGQDPITEFLPADITSPDAGVIAGVMSVDELREEYLGAINDEADATDLLVDAEGRALVSNRYMEAAIRRAAAHVSRVLGTTFGVLRYACNPELGTALEEDDYDAEVEALPWASHQRSDLNAGLLTLAHAPLVSVTRVRLFIGQTQVATVPVGWVTITSKRNAQLSIIPNGTSSLDILETQYAHLASGSFLALDSRPSGTLPAVWALDYEAGLADVPDDIKAAIGWRAAADVLAVAAVKANKAAVSSQNVSMDGVSRSQSTSDTQPGGRYARLLGTDLVKRWTDPEDKALIKLKERSARGALLL